MANSDQQTTEEVFRVANTWGETAPFFEWFPYVCPEPVLVKRSFVYKMASQKGRFYSPVRLLPPMKPSRTMFAERPRSTAVST
eukprot:COSAG06_NODE_31490_length_520_cov_3.997625_1_plen_82_part_01